MSKVSINKLIGDLFSPDVSKRRTAAQALAEGDERAIHPLIKALRDKNPGVQDAAVRSLIGIGGEVVAYMVLPLLREDSYLRNTGMLILRELGGVSVPLLYPLLEDKDEDVRKFCLDILADIREGVVPEKVAPLMEDPNPNVRASALRAIGALRHKGAMEQVIKALDDIEWVSFSAIETLGELKVESSVDALTGMLSSDAEALRIAALEALGKIGSTRAGEAIAACMGKAVGDEKAAAVKSLVQIGIPPSMPGVGEQLIEMFQEAEWEGKLIALQGLLALKEQRAVRLIIDTAGSLDPSVPEDDEMLRTIMEALRGFGCTGEFVNILADPGIRYRGKVIAAEVVAPLGCREAVPNLIELFRNQTRDVRRACLNALGNIDDPEARRVVIQAVSDADSHVRKQAAAFMGKMGGKEAFDLLMGRISEETYGDVMEEVVKSLLIIDTGAMASRLAEFRPAVREAIGKFAAEADILLRLSMDESLEVRLSALSGLGNMGGKEALKRVMEATHDETPEVRRAAVMALGGTEFSLGEIKPLLSDSDRWVRVYAARALGQSRNSEVIAVLKPMLKDREVAVVVAAVEAIAMIGGKEAVATLKARAGHSAEAVREAVREALQGLE